MHAKYNRGSNDITPQRLRGKAIAYIGRYASSANHLKGVLLRWSHRSNKFHDDNRTTVGLWIDQVVGDLVKNGLLNDRSFAESKVQSLLRQGKPLWIIERTLSAKGVEKDVIQTVIGELKKAIYNPDFVAAANLARRKRLGPFLAQDHRVARKVKDLEVMARAGFDFDVARSVIEARSPEDLELQNTQ